MKSRVVQTQQGSQTLYDLRNNIPQRLASAGECQWSTQVHSAGRCAGTLDPRQDYALHSCQSAKPLFTAAESAGIALPAAAWQAMKPAGSRPEPPGSSGKRYTALQGQSFSCQQIKVTNVFTSSACLGSCCNIPFCFFFPASLFLSHDFQRRSFWHSTWRGLGIPR